MGKTNIRSVRDSLFILIFPLSGNSFDAIGAHFGKQTQYYLHIDPSINVLVKTKVPPKAGNFKSDGKANMNFDFGFGYWNFQEKRYSAGSSRG